MSHVHILQVVAGAGAVAVAVWLAQAYLFPPMARWWRGHHQEPSPADKAAAAVAAAIQAQVCAAFHSQAAAAAPGLQTCISVPGV